MAARDLHHDDALLLAAAQGDQLAFERFYRRWAAPVTSFHLRRTARPDVAFDLAAETWAAVVVGCHGFDPARGSAAGWLFTLAANELRDSVRRGRVEDGARRRLGHEPIVLEDEDLGRVEELARDGEHSLERLLAELPPAQRAAVLARVVEERPYPEIAAALECSEAVVRQRVHRGLRSLRTRLEERT